MVGGQTKHPAVFLLLITHWYLTLSLRQAYWSNSYAHAHTHARADTHTHTRKPEACKNLWLMTQNLILSKHILSKITSVNVLVQVPIFFLLKGPWNSGDISQYSIRPQAGQSRNRGSISNKGKNFLSFQNHPNGFWILPRLVAYWYRGIFPQR
jgi:hypothetical protein